MRYCGQLNSDVLFCVNLEGPREEEIKTKATKLLSLAFIRTVVVHDL